MPAPEFLDTNVLVYAYDSSSRRKQPVAQRSLRAALAGHSVISAQVLAEFAATLLHKVSPAIAPSDLVSILNALEPVKVLAPDAGVIRRAVEARATYGIHFYDGMIVAAAEKAGCKRIWSEDFNSGQKYFGVIVENPFP
ncbi:MAG: PIN domain-containing protein [Acidobacteriaceae bacterium]|nr:PIN domain-containing protein [Acidobacteriaceae bacterium]MBV9296753.1 PIN domain-containing protein [Acidobacteriaceae bacterium]